MRAGGEDVEMSEQTRTKSFPHLHLTLGEEKKKRWECTAEECTAEECTAEECTRSNLG